MTAAQHRIAHTAVLIRGKRIRGVRVRVRGKGPPGGRATVRWRECPSSSRPSGEEGTQTQQKKKEPPSPDLAEKKTREGQRGWENERANDE